MSINERGEFIRDLAAPDRDDANSSPESKFMYPGDETLKEKDRKLNIAFREFTEIASRLGSMSEVVVREADPEGNPVAEINTEKLQIVKDYMFRMAQLIKNIESLGGIIDTKPVSKQLSGASGTESE